ncbi:response regulator [Paraburkholderia caffeinilytica]|uniref:hypothetical protein n=1 Tax=Paraburkholderia caffeinilytica TaxID=1761016 RepID=UPI0038B9DD6F
MALLLLTFVTQRLPSRIPMKLPQRKSPATIPVEVRRVLDLILSSVMAFDRLTCWIDHPAPDIPIAQIKPHCADLKVLNCRSSQFHPVWQTQVQILQPGRQALIELQRAVGARYRVRLSYAEPALDSLVNDRNAAETIRLFMLKHLRVPYMRHAVRFEQATAYFARRASTDGKKTARNLVLYADGTSKLWPLRELKSPCCHIEYRLQGVDTLAEYGLLSLTDCIRFDHQAFWTENLRLFRLPSHVQLGRWINPKTGDVTDTALANRAKRFFARYSHGDAFVLQDCWRETPRIAHVLTPVDNKLFFANVTS